jgi:hypothetical protein
MIDRHHDRAVWRKILVSCDPAGIPIGRDPRTIALDRQAAAACGATLWATRSEASDPLAVFVMPATTAAAAVAPVFQSRAIDLTIDGWAL